MIVKKKIIVKWFKKTGISNAMDGIEYELIYEKNKDLDVNDYLDVFVNVNFDDSDTSDEVVHDEYDN